MVTKNDKSDNKNKDNVVVMNMKWCQNSENVNDLIMLVYNNPFENKKYIALTIYNRKKKEKNYTILYYIGMLHD